MYVLYAIPITQTNSFGEYVEKDTSAGYIQEQNLIYLLSNGGDAG